MTLFKQGGEGEGGLMGQTTAVCRAGWSPLEWVKDGGITLWVFLVTMLLEIERKLSKISRKIPRTGSLFVRQDTRGIDHWEWELPMVALCGSGSDLVHFEW